jgi:dipeptidyl aminopeptidase/acylaminoacyl peptidase
MSIKRLGLAAMSAFTLCVAGGAARAAVAGLESYGRLPDLADVRVSPSGRQLAYVSAAGSDQVVTVVTADGSQKPDILHVGDTPIRDIDWADDNHIVVVTSRVQAIPIGVESPAPTQNFSQGFVYDLQRKKAVLLSPPGNEAAGLNDLLGEPAIRQVNGRATVFFKATTFREHRNVPTLLSMDLQSNVTKTVDQGDLAARDFAIGLNGGEAAQSFYNHGQWSVMVNTPGGWRTAALPPSVEQPSLLGLGPKGDTILVSVRAQPGDAGGARQISLKDGAWLPDTLPAGSVLRDPQTGVAIAYTRERNGARVYEFIDPADEKTWNAILKAFPGEQVDFVSASTDRKQIAVEVFGPRTGAAFMLVHMATGQGELIGDIHQGLTPDNIAETRFITYAAADGLKIPAYLTVPRGRAEKNLPLVVLPHGTPDARDTLGFNWIAQALASRGYAVLQPQYRGSTVNPALRTAGYGEWGGKMLTDMADGVRFLAAQGVVDAKRVCIMGDGYGGYAALAGVTLNQGVYRCAVSVGGYSDMKRFLDWQEPRLKTNNSAIPYLEKMLGVKTIGDPVLAQVSPYRLAARADAPILLIHGDKDVAVPIEQSQIMAEALTAAHKPVRMVVLKDEDHRLSRSDTRQQMLEAAVGFIEANNPPDPSPTRTASAQP